MNFGGAISGIGGLIAGEQLKQGYDDAAASLERAAKMEDVNVEIEKGSVDLQTYGIDRAINRATRGIRSDQFGAGFKFTGSALDVSRDSTAQANLGKALVVNQGAINEEGYLIQAESFRGQAALDKAQGAAAETNGIFGAIAGFAGMMG